MKKLLKSEICESVNSARVHCSWLTWSNSAAGKKKKNAAQDLAENTESKRAPNVVLDIMIGLMAKSIMS